MFGRKEVNNIAKVLFFKKCFDIEIFEFFVTIDFGSSISIRYPNRTLDNFILFKIIRQVLPLQYFERAL